MKSSSGPYGNESACQFGQWGPRPLSVKPEEFQLTSLYSSTPSSTPFSIHCDESRQSSCMEEIVLGPGENAKLGPVSFSPRRTGKSYSVVYVRNNVTGLETVILQGEGAQASVLIVGINDGYHHDDKELSSSSGQRGHWSNERVARVTALVASDNSAHVVGGHAVVPSVRLPTIVEDGNFVDGGAVRANGTYVLLNVGNTRVVVHNIGFGTQFDCATEDSYGAFSMSGITNTRKKSSTVASSLSSKSCLGLDEVTLEPSEWYALEIVFDSTCYSELSKAEMSIHLSHGSEEKVERVDEFHVYGHVSSPALSWCMEDRMIHHWSSSGKMFLTLFLSGIVVLMSMNVLNDYSMMKVSKSISNKTSIVKSMSFTNNEPAPVGTTSDKKENKEVKDKVKRTAVKNTAALSTSTIVASSKNSKSLNEKPSSIG